MSKGMGFMSQFTLLYLEEFPGTLLILISFHNFQLPFMILIVANLGTSVLIPSSLQEASAINPPKEKLPLLLPCLSPFP